MSDQQTCQDCRYSFPQPLGTFLCRRFPPLPIATKVDEDGKGLNVHTTSAWPPVPPFGWCGEYQNRVKATVTMLQPATIVQQWPQRDPGDENPPKEQG